MAQSILDVALPEFRKSIYSIDVRNLVLLIQGIQELKGTLRNKVTDPQILDIARKEAIIQKELIRRKYLTKKDSENFNKWLNSHFVKKNF